MPGGQFSQFRAASNILAGTYTVATLPTPSAAMTRKYAWVTDLFGGPGDYCVCDGSWWRPVRPLSLASGAAADMTLTALLSAPTQIVSGTIGVGVTRTVTLATLYAYPGAKFRVVRQASGLGLLLGGLGVSLPLNGWADYEWSGVAGAWVQTASGGLL